MKILYVSQYYPPEMGAPAARVSELATRWAALGRDVTVLTGFPNHPTGVVPVEYRSRLRRLVMRENGAGVQVVRTWLMPLPNRKTIERVLNYSSFCLSGAVTGTFLSRPDVVVATSPQLLVGLTGWWISRVKRAPFVLEIRDLWPESLMAVGVASENSAAVRTLRSIAAFLYRKADHIVVVSPAFKDALVSDWNVDPARISTVVNGVETSLFAPAAALPPIPFRPEFHGKFVAGYIGTLGNAHGLGAVLEAAALLQHDPGILFAFTGEGAEREQLVAAASERKLGNVLFMGQQDRSRIPNLIRSVDVCLVTLRKAEVFKTVIPTKMLEFMACGKPVVLGVAGQAARIVQDAQAGICVEPEDAVGLAGAVERLRNDAALRRDLGLNGRKHILENFSREETARRYAALLDSIVRGTDARSACGRSERAPQELCSPGERRPEAVPGDGPGVSDAKAR